MGIGGQDLGGGHSSSSPVAQLLRQVLARHETETQHLEGSLGHVPS